MEESRPLHPNLADLASAYRKLHRQYDSGEIDQTEARARIAALVTRDDQGVQWRLDPGTGQWERQLRDLSWEKADPPTYGVQTLHASDLSHLGPNADVDLSGYASFEVDEDKLLPPRSVFGSSRKVAIAARDAEDDDTPSTSRVAKVAAGVAGATVAGAAVWQLAGLLG